MDNRDQTVTASWLLVIAGVWLLAAPFVLGYVLPDARVNDMLVGAVVGLLGLIRAYYPQRSAVSRATLIAGLWLLAAPFVIGYVSTAAIWNDVILGVFVTAISAWLLGAGRRQIMVRTR